VGDNDGISYFVPITLPVVGGGVDFTDLDQ